MTLGNPTRQAVRIGRVVTTGLICSCLLLGGCSGTRTSGGASGDTASAIADDAYHLVSPDEARSLMVGGDLVVVDVRTASEYASGHLRGAINVPLDTIVKATSVADLASLPDPSTPLMVYCRTGVRSQQAAGALIALGYTEVYDLQGGITAWTGETTGGGDSCTAPR